MIEAWNNFKGLDPSFRNWTIDFQEADYNLGIYGKMDDKASFKISAFRKRRFRFDDNRINLESPQSQVIIPYRNESKVGQEVSILLFARDLRIETESK